MASVIPPFAYWAGLLVLAALFLALAFWLRLRWPPAYFLRLGLVALALLLVFSPQQAERRTAPSQPLEVLLIENSQAVHPDALDAARRTARRWAAAGPGRLVASFSGEVVPLLDPLQPAWPEPAAAARPEAALRYTSGLLGERGGTVYLAVSGQVQDAPAVGQAVKDLRARGIDVRVLRLDSNTEGPQAAGMLHGPQSLWEGTPFDLALQLPPSDDPAPQDLTLLVNGQPAAVEFTARDGDWHQVRLPGLQQGIHTLEVQAVSPTADGEARVSHAYGVVRVFPQPRVLFVTNEPSSPQVNSFVQALRQAGMQVERAAPERLPTSLTALQNYRTIFLHNLLASRLSSEQMLALQIFVSRQGGGLIFLGGRSSYTLGGYSGTLLEPLLPVRLQPPPRGQRPPILFVLVMDRSYSMSETAYGSPVQPIELAREAAMRAIETLKPDDLLGVLTFATDYTWDVRVGPLGDGLSLRQALDAVSRVRASGGTMMHLGLQQALDGAVSAAGQEVAARHILLLSDGMSSDGSPELFREIGRQARENDIAISTIALGEADQEVLALIAEESRGRAYVVSDPAGLPRIMVLESQAAQSDNLQAGETGLELGESQHPILFGMNAAQLPTLNTYNALTSRREEGAEDVLVSASFGDPLLSVWQYGLGRVAAWMSDIGEEWTGEWSSPGLQANFWSQVVRYTLTSPALEPAVVEVTVEPSALRVQADILQGDQPLNLAGVTFTYLGQDGQVQRYALPQEAPGVYAASLPLPPPGAYRGALTYTLNGEERETAAPFAVNPPGPAALTLEQAGSNLSDWAIRSGSSLGGLEDLDGSPPPPPESEDAGASRDWRGPLLLLLVLLWPLEIAVRRRWLPWN